MQLMTFWIGTLTLSALFGGCKPRFNEAEKYELDYEFSSCNKLEMDRCKPNAENLITVTTSKPDVHVTFFVKKLDQERDFIVERCELYDTKEKKTVTSCQLNSMKARKTNSPEAYTSKLAFAKPLEEGDYILKISYESGGRVFLYWPDLKVKP